MSVSDKDKKPRKRVRRSKGDKADYEVGYKKPPRDGQFQKGKSGNPDGRPKGSKNFDTILLEILDRKIWMSLEGKKVRATGRDAAAYSVFKKAIEGDAKCLNMLRLIDCEKYLKRPEEGSDEKKHSTLSKADAEILAEYRKSILKMRRD